MDPLGVGCAKVHPTRQDVVVRVRPAEVEEVAEITRAYLASWRAGYEGLLAADVLDFEGGRRATYDWAAEVRAVSTHVGVAVAADVVLGVVEASDPPGGSRDLPEITMLYVVPEYWGTGVASSLLANGVGWIRERGWETARLRVVERQARVRRFYEREGWRLDTELEPAHNGFFALVYYRRDLSL